jgi:8-oxo-dGTP pyrophosphatase MutT (NUDIX family)
MSRVIKKVTAFITRETESGRQLLLFEHPFAGIQIPAGTVEPSESPEKAVIREVLEETGLNISSKPVSLGYHETHLSSNEAFVLPPATVYARPDTASFDWIEIRSAVQVKVIQKVNGFTQINYTEHDQVPEHRYVSMLIIGWVPDKFLTQIQIRYFFHLECTTISKTCWKVFSDHHTLNIFWASCDNLPGIIPPQDEWLSYLTQYIPSQ